MNMIQHKKSSIKAKKITKNKKAPFYRKKIVILPGIVVVAVAIILLAFRVSPVPGATVIKIVFTKDAHQKRENMEKVPSNISKVTVLSDINYAYRDKDAQLDIYIPEAATSSPKGFPIVIWTHGGAWLSGDKTNVAPYFKRLADKGFIVVAPNYTLAPAKTYPTQVHQLNRAYDYVSKSASQFHGDSSRIILAGDSAGAQLSSQLAAITTNPSYAKEMDITPSLKASQISAMVLYCGIYKMETLAEPHKNLSKIISWGDRITVWSYTGTRDAKTPLLKQMSAYYHINNQFPTTFISGGNGDELTAVQSKPFAKKLQSLGVDVKTKFYANDHSPKLAHENQFVLDKDGLENFEIMTQFLKEKVR